MIPAMSGLARPEHLATPEWLAEVIGRPEVRVLDARWRPDGSAPAVFAAGHVPGATLVDWRAESVDTGEEGEALRLATATQVSALAQRADIGDGSTVVIYDDTQGLYASRVWWTLRAYGLESVRVLDGGYPAWVDGGHRIERTSTSVPAGRRLHAARAQPHAPDHGRRARSAGLTGGHPARCAGARRVPRLRGQHPPARPHPGCGQRAGRRDARRRAPSGCADGDALRARLHSANVSRGRRMVTYDGSGVAAAKLAFILTLLGHEDVAVYDGGWAEWGNRLDLPVDR